MNTLIQRLLNACRSDRAGLLLFAGLSLATVLFLSLPQEAFSLAAAKPAPSNEAGPVQITVKPSQTTFVQGGNNTLYLDVAIKAPLPEQPGAAPQATDMVIVLDRSGSMAGAEKMPYAKAAIQDVLSRLTERDRFALVSFSDNAVVHTPLLTVDAAQRENLNAIVGNIVAAGGTNMGDGLNSALALMSGNGGERVRKVLLLSDGQANQGITQPEALAQLATQSTRYGAVLSTIGMGLDFNETVMTQLADRGMGHYAFLENLAGLGQILNADLSATRSIFATGSTLEIALGDGVKLLDAGGYPLTQTEPASVSIASGQLLAGADKHFVVSLSVPAENTGSFALGKMHLSYQQQGRDYRTPVNANLQLTVVEPEKRQEAVGSINKDVYQQSWLKNNLGLMQKKLGESVREGKKDQADQAIDEYRQAVQAAEAESNIPLASPAMSGRLDDMKAKVEEAFVGGRDEQAQKQKRAAKTMQYDAIKEQRAN
jgi:Ca-activated chloride channel family protein